MRTALEFDPAKLRAPRVTDAALSPALAFGLGAGVHFEYFLRLNVSPSHFFIGHNRNLSQELDTHLREFTRGNPHRALLSALRANAWLMNLDRSSNSAIMGMELVADDFENWANAPDWAECARHAAATINETESLHRRLYLRFLEENASALPSARALGEMLQEIADEWDALGVILDAIADASSDCGFAQASRMMRRLALREEHFWGRVLEISDL